MKEKPSEKINKIMEGSDYRYTWPFTKNLTSEKVRAIIQYLDEEAEKKEKE